MTKRDISDWIIAMPVTRRLFVPVLFCIAINLTMLSPVHAEYYTYVDEAGNVHYTDNPSALPTKTLNRTKRVDVDMGVKKKPAAEPQAGQQFEEIELGGRPAMKRAKKAIKASPPLAVGMGSAPIQTQFQPPPPEVVVESPDPALSTPLKTIRHFRRSLASGDYAAAAKCLRLDDVREVHAFLSQLPKEFAMMLAEEFSPAVEIVRDDNQAIYMIGDARKQGNKVMRRHEVYLEKVGPNWKIAH